eukprot:2951944-Prymnesium_polylepis.1
MNEAELDAIELDAIVAGAGADTQNDPSMGVGALQLPAPHVVAAADAAAEAARQGGGAAAAFIDVPAGRPSRRHSPQDAGL